ncbi:hypothetical protein TSUD_274020 [Trifolium subterraneum]|uniref:Reverse transcriptase domain-containing protein n=1 Tax=Trifolium subterraneum TaxID=3900 RepID=A0A2Z6M4P2_TRISU|nr:hypothetical protein TSUD_274020 [Trifolium subterraneum]
MAPFSVDEVREVIWSCDGNKCPGPDGYNFNFLKSCWEIIKCDIMEFMAEFHKNAVLPKAITASFLALIPKKDHPQVLSDYRPICLVSSLYKILTKVLAARLKKVMGNLISEVQLAFLPNRKILDGVLVVNELIDLAKRRKDNCLFFNVDFERACDTVNWNFLEYMLIRMGFTEGWRRWIRACVFQSSMYVLVNGSTTEDFCVGKGLRQGDPLSPFLFLIVAEGLSGLMRRAVDSGLFHGYKVSNNMSFHTLQFADDTIIVGEDNSDNLWTIKTVLRSFEIVSGLKVNFYNSIPFGSNPRRRATWSPIVDTLKKRLCAWNGRNLSIGGRVTLINSVLSSLPLYFFSFYKAPASVIKEMPNAHVSSMGEWLNNSWSWKFDWIETLTEEEEAAVGDLKLLLEQVQPCRDNKDRRRWIPNTIGLFSVMSAYAAMQDRSTLPEMESNTFRFRGCWIDVVQCLVRDLLRIFALSKSFTVGSAATCSSSTRSVGTK